MKKKKKDVTQCHKISLLQMKKKKEEEEETQTYIYLLIKK